MGVCAGVLLSEHAHAGKLKGQVKGESQPRVQPLNQGDSEQTNKQHPDIFQSVHGVLSTKPDPLEKPKNVLHHLCPPGADRALHWEDYSPSVPTPSQLSSSVDPQMILIPTLAALS